MTYKALDANDWIALQPERVREAGETLAEARIRDVTLRQLREALRRTQAEVASATGVTQDRISKLENGSDVLVSTLRRHVRALGGELRLVAEFPGLPPVPIDLGSQGRNDTPRRGRRKSGATAG
jgi:DNA-binding XRE family transcriptional regulator